MKDLILQSFDVDMPLPKIGFKREWVESSKVCGQFVSGYWHMRYMCKPTKAHMWDENGEDWVSCRQYMNLVGRDDPSNEEVQLAKRDADRERATNTNYSPTNCELNESSSSSFDLI